MSFTDPLSITVSTVTSSLPRTSVGDDESEYTSSDGLLQVSASHQYGKRTRRLLRVDTSKIAPDPFKPAENVKLSMSFYIVFDMPQAGFTAAEAMALYTGFSAMYGASSSAMVTKLLGGES